MSNGAPLAIHLSAGQVDQAASGRPAFSCVGVHGGNFFRAALSTAAHGCGQDLT